MRIVSFYTPDYAGEREAWERAIIESGCGFDFWTKAVEDRGSWRKNCGLKPHFILGCLEQLDEPVLWVDIDGRVRGKLELAPALEEKVDFACWFIPAAKLRSVDRPGGKAGIDGTASGTMFFNNTDLARDLLTRWIHNDHGQYGYEQIVLGETWHFGRPEGIRWMRLPQSWCKVFDVKWFDGEKGPVEIEHLQASRRLKRVRAKQC